MIYSHTFIQDSRSVLPQLKEEFHKLENEIRDLYHKEKESFLEACAKLLLPKELFEEAIKADSAYIIIDYFTKNKIFIKDELITLTCYRSTEIIGILKWEFKDGMFSVGKKINYQKETMSTPTKPTDTMGNSKREPALLDTDAMPFGKHKGTKMEDVPAQYLRWLKNEGCTNVLVANYIHNSWGAIEEELDDDNYGREAF